MGKVTRVLLVIPNFGIGGAQRSFAKLVNWLSDRYEVKVAVFDNAYANPYPFSADVHYLSYSAVTSLFSKVIRLLRRRNALQRLKNDFAPDVSISFLEGADYLNMLTSAGESRYISIRGSKRYDPHIRGFSGWVRRRILLPALYRRADGVVAASKGLANEIGSDYPALRNKTRTIPNGFAAHNTPPPPAASGRFVFVWAGRFGDEKGLDELVGVFMHVHQADDSVRILLLGDGPLLQPLRQKLAEADFRCAVTTQVDPSLWDTADVVFCNPGTAYESTLRQGHLFVITSPSEGFPNVIIEAFQQGLPVISTDCRWGPRELLEPDSSSDAVLTYPVRGKYGILMPVIVSDVDRTLWAQTLLSLRNDAVLLKKYRDMSPEAVRPYDQDHIIPLWYRLLEG